MPAKCLRVDDAEGTSKQRKLEVVELRSDTLTVPDEHMRKAMAEAEVGDDVYVEDPTVIQLQKRVAEMFGKEDALFVPSGTMGNIICMTLHCGTSPFDEAICGDNAHTFLYEVGNCARIGGVSTVQIPTSKNGELPLDKVKAAIRCVDIHFATTKLLVLENTHNKCGGKALSMEYVRACRKLCDENNMKLHCDGARIWHAAIALDLPLKDVAAPYDTMSVCLSKGIGAPIGSCIVGTSSFIAQARRLRKMLGGGMRQVGVIAAGALYALDNLLPRLHEDHKMASLMADELKQRGFDVIPPQTNIVMIKVDEAVEEPLLDRCVAKGLNLVSFGEGWLRAVPHYGNTTEQIMKAVSILAEAMAELKHE